MSRRVMLLLVLSMAVPLTMYYFSLHIRSTLRGAYSLYANPPVAYTIELEDSLMCKSTGEASVVDKRVVARRSDGSKVFAHELRGTNTLNKHRRIHTADGLYILVDDVLGTTITYREFPAGSNVRELNSLEPATDCQTTRSGGKTSTEVIGHDEVLGYRAVKAVSESQADRWTFWLAPDLACEILQQIIEFARPGEPFELNSHMTATKVRLGEPDAYLFEVPEGYNEISFVDHLVEKAKFHAARKGVAFTPEMEHAIRSNPGKAFQYAEEAYRSKRP